MSRVATAGRLLDDSTPGRNLRAVRSHEDLPLIVMVKRAFSDRCRRDVSGMMEMKCCRNIRVARNEVRLIIM